MGPLKNGRRELFCQGIAAGKTQTQAYIDAGYSERSARNLAPRLMSYDVIRARVSEIQGKAGEKVEYGIAEWLEMNKRILRESLDDNDRGNALKAQEQIAKHLGAYDADHHRYLHADHDDWLMAHVEEDEQDGIRH